MGPLDEIAGSLHRGVLLTPGWILAHLPRGDLKALWDAERRLAPLVCVAAPASSAADYLRVGCTFARNAAPCVRPHEGPALRAIEGSDSWLSGGASAEQVREAFGGAQYGVALASDAFPTDAHGPAWDELDQLLGALGELFELAVETHDATAICEPLLRLADSALDLETRARRALRDDIERQFVALFRSMVHCPALEALTER